MLKKKFMDVSSRRAASNAQEKFITSPIALKEVAPGHSSACLRIQLGEIDLAPAFAGRNF
jgi:hypothetical protein